MRACSDAAAGGMLEEVCARTGCMNLLVMTSGLSVSAGFRPVNESDRIRKLGARKTSARQGSAGDAAPPRSTHLRPWVRPLPPACRRPAVAATTLPSRACSGPLNRG